jgi:hypothetical protein
MVALVMKVASGFEFSFKNSESFSMFQKVFEKPLSEFESDSQPETTQQQQQHPSSKLRGTKSVTSEFNNLLQNGQNIKQNIANLYMAEDHIEALQIKGNSESSSKGLNSLIASSATDGAPSVVDGETQAMNNAAMELEAVALGEAAALGSDEKMFNTLFTGPPKPLQSMLITPVDPVALVSSSTSSSDKNGKLSRRRPLRMRTSQ